MKVRLVVALALQSGLKGGTEYVEVVFSKSCVWSFLLFEDVDGADNGVKSSFSPRDRRQSRACFSVALYGTHAACMNDDAPDLVQY